MPLVILQYLYSLQIKGDPKKKGIISFHPKVSSQRPCINWSARSLYLSIITVKKSFTDMADIVNSGAQHLFINAKLKIKRKFIAGGN
jgi:hypothetical protein